MKNDSIPPATPIFFSTIHCAIPEYPTNGPFNWLNKQYVGVERVREIKEWDVIEAKNPAVFKQLVDATSAAHRGRQGSIEFELQKSGEFKPLKLLFGGKTYTLKES